MVINKHSNQNKREIASENPAIVRKTSQLTYQWTTHNQMDICSMKIRISGLASTGGVQSILNRAAIVPNTDNYSP